MQPSFSLNLYAATIQECARYERALATTLKIGKLGEPMANFIYSRMPQCDGVPTEEVCEYLEKSLRLGQSALSISEELKTELTCEP